MKSSRVTWMEHVLHAEGIINAYKIFVRKFLGRDHLGDLGIGG
jgi:hypothetical protein